MYRKFLPTTAKSTLFWIDFFRTVLDSQFSIKYSFQIIPVHTLAQPPLQVASHTRVVHLLELINLHWHTFISQGPQLTFGFTLGGVHVADFDKRINKMSNIVLSCRIISLLSNSSVLTCSSLPPLKPWQPLIFYCSLALSFPECHVLGIIQYEAFSD